MTKKKKKNSKWKKENINIRALPSLDEVYHLKINEALGVKHKFLCQKADFL